MKKFSFRLERILALKAALKRQAEIEASRAEYERRQQQQILDNLQNEYVVRLQDEKSRRHRKLDVLRLDATQRYFGQLRFLIAHQIQQVSLAEAKLLERRRRLLEATREEKKYLRLKEIRRSAYIGELERQLQKETDESARQVYRRSHPAPAGAVQ